MLVWRVFSFFFFLRCDLFINYTMDIGKSNDFTRKNLK